VLFHHPIQVFLPYVTTGFIVWGFINGCLIEGMDTFIANEGLIKHLPAPLTVYALRTVWRQTLMLGHNLIVYVIMVGIFFGALDHPYQLDPNGQWHPGLGLWSLTAIPAFALIALNGMWLTLALGIISTRYRDIPQVINSVIQLAFYLTPIVWSPDDLFGNGSSNQWAKVVFQLNPLYHFVQIMRAPLIGQHVSLLSWAVVGGITVVGWAVALFAMRNYRSRVSYWV
jgi:ABC-2 type transport system permease protein